MQLIDRQFQSSRQLTSIMSTYQKIRKMVTDMKKHTLLHSLKNVTSVQLTPSKKDDPSMNSQTNLTLFPILNIVDQSDKKTDIGSQEDKLNGKKLISAKTRQKKESRKRKQFNSVSFRISRKNKEDYLETLNNVSSILTNPIGTKTRISQVASTTINSGSKSVCPTHRTLSFAENSTPMSKTVKGEPFVLKKERSTPRNPRKFTSKRIRPSSSPQKLMSPPRKWSISAWQTHEQSQINLF